MRKVHENNRSCAVRIQELLRETTIASDICNRFSLVKTQYYNELTNSGMKLYSKSQLDKIKSEFQTRFQNWFENDVTDSISITNRGMILLKKVLARK